MWEGKKSKEWKNKTIGKRKRGMNMKNVRGEKRLRREGGKTKHEREREVLV